MTSSNRDNLLGVFQTLYRWRKTIRNVCLLTAVGSIGGSLLLKDHYQAVTTFYPVSTQVFSPELTFGYTSQVQNYFGDDRELDRYLEIANGNELRDYMVRRFDLYTKYGIDSTSKKGPYTVREIFSGYYSAQKNKNDAVEVTMEDTDPVMAANMANAARDCISQIAQRIVKESQGDLLKAFENNLKEKQLLLTTLSDSLMRMQNKYKIFDAEILGQQLSTQLTGAEAEVIKNSARLEVLQNNPLVPQDTVEFIKAERRAYEKQRDLLRGATMPDGSPSLTVVQQVMPLMLLLKDQHFQSRKQMTYDLERYNMIRAAYTTNTKAVHTVETATPPLIKSRPKRSIIVIASVVAAFFFTLLAILIAEAYKDIKL
jgi:tyrosine-protein kinase Etk/Wzc